VPASRPRPARAATRVHRRHGPELTTPSRPTTTRPLPPRRARPSALPARAAEGRGWSSPRHSR
jgi:hypothetical protein